MCYLLKKIFWWLLPTGQESRIDIDRRHVNTAENAISSPDIFISNWFDVQYLQTNVIMQWTTRFIRFTGWIPLKYGSTTTPPIIAHCKKTPMSSLIFHTANPNLQYKTHPEFWPHKRIFKTCLYYTTCLILENWFCPTILRPMHCQADLPFLVLAFVSAGSPAPWGTPSSHPAVSADDPHMSHAVCPLALTLQPWGVYRSVFLWELCKCLLKWI